MVLNVVLIFFLEEGNIEEALKLGFLAADDEMVHGNKSVNYLA